MRTSYGAHSVLKSSSQHRNTKTELMSMRKGCLNNYCVNVSVLGFHILNGSLSCYCHKLCVHIGMLGVGVCVLYAKCKIDFIVSWYNKLPHATLYLQTELGATKVSEIFLIWHDVSC